MRKILFYSILILLPVLASAQKADTVKYSQIMQQIQPNTEENKPGLLEKVWGYTDSISTIRNHIVDFSLSFIGTPYKFASIGPNAFDCSGFISYLYKLYNIILPHSSSLQSQMGKIVDMASAIKGDLMFFGYKNRDGSYSVSHVGMVYNRDGETIEMIHASSSNGVKIDRTDSNVWSSYWSRKFLFVKRIID